MQYWRNNANGLLEHSPTALYQRDGWGPNQACPYLVTVTEDGIELTSPTGVKSLNPGVARWLGNRLIEAAVLSEAEQSKPMRPAKDG